MLEKVIESDWKEAMEYGSRRADGGFPGSPVVKNPPAMRTRVGHNLASTPLPFLY